MVMPLSEYAKVKDKYCIAYFGNCDDYLVQLRLLRPMMELAYPGVLVYISHKDSASHIFSGADRTLTRTELESSRNQFAYVRELSCDMSSHPVEQFMKESEIACGPVITTVRPKTGRCVLLTQAMLPAKSLTATQISAMCEKLNAGGCDSLSVDGNIDDAGVVIGVECGKLFEAGSKGIKVILVATGFGENIFKCMYPSGTVIRI